MKVNGQLENAGLEQRGAGPTPTPAYPGRLYIDTTFPAAAVPYVYDGTTWQKLLISYQQTPNDIVNLGLAVSVQSSAMTIAIKQSDGSTDPLAAQPVYVSFRSATSANGSYIQRSLAAASSLVVPASATLGMSNAVPKYLWLYMIDNAGTMEPAICGVRLDDGSIQSSTTISGSATSSSVLYSTTGRSNKAIRLIGRIFVSEATAGTWASLPTEITLNPKNAPAKCMAAYYGDNTTYADTNLVQFNNKIFDNLNAVVTGGSWLFTCPVGHAGPYRVTVTADVLSAVTTGWKIQVNSVSIGSYLNPTVGKAMSTTLPINLKEGDTVKLIATNALQMENTVAQSPNILIEQLEWS